MAGSRATQLVEAIGGCCEYLARTDHDGGGKGDLAGQQVQLAEEPAVTVDADDVLLRRPVPLDGSHFPGHDDEKVAVPVSLPERDKTGCVARRWPSADSAAIRASSRRG